MNCPTLEELPPPPPGKAGWPWTAASSSMPAAAADGAAWPRITVVTPSFNQARFLEETIRSILLQGYPDLEYLVLDGGSTDGSVDLIRKYERWIRWWVSEPDGGQSAAINRGLANATGEFATWINSDDMLSQDALVNHARRAGVRRDVVYVGDCLYIDERSDALHLHRGRVHSLEDLLRVRTVWRDVQDRGHIVQPEVLFPRELAIRLGGLNEANHLAMDYELWGKFFLAGTHFEYTHIPFGTFRFHGEQKTSQTWATTKSLVGAAARLAADATELPEHIRREVIADLWAYQREYWRSTGPLARLGLPEDIVLPLRDSHLKWRRRAAALVRRGTHSDVSR